LKAENLMMKNIKFRFLRKPLADQRGQSAVLVAAILATTIALAGASVEVGHIYYAYRQLVASTDAATLAAAQVMPDITEATTFVTDYSSETGKYNYSNLLQNDSITPTYFCSSTVSTKLNISCQTPPSGEGSCTTGSTCNAVKVVQTAKVNLWFGGLIGIRTFNLSATATAAMRGGSDIPYNIAVIIDTTASMTSTANSKDGCGNGATQIQCAVTGLKTMLQQMDPCPLNTTCSASGAYVDGVSLFVFPAIAAGHTSSDTTCPTTNPPIVPYNFINVSTGSSQNLNMQSSTTGANGSYAGTYEVASFNNTYRANDDATTPLSGSDPLAVAAGGGGGSCQGLQAPGGYGTYYAQVIYAAQAALVAQQITYPSSQNVMIILSDGDATACATSANTAAGACNSKADLVALNCPTAGGTGCNTTTNPPLNGTGTKTNNPNGYQSATYPSALGECGQAVQAAQAATKAGTTVYTVAMGSETTGGCTTDANYTISAGSTYGAESWPAGAYAGQPCNAIGAMASNVNTFFSDNTGGCSATGGNANFTSIASIFQAIGESLTAARLIPNGTT
jgi:Flp pilus assembly protein TadG